MGVERILFGDELIGFAAGNLETSAGAENDAQWIGQAVESEQPPPPTFNPHLLKVAENIYQARRKRDVQFGQFFGEGLFCEPAWDVLLDLYINNSRRKAISVSSACLAASVPTSTALRHVAELVRRQLVVRYPHPHDRRTFVLRLSALAVSAMEELLALRAEM
jgi:DNA-binding MarR family transcriptional regulator